MIDLVSVIMPVYNAADTVNQSIDSVLQQSYSNLELIVVNDGSTDDTAMLLSRYAVNERVKVVNLQRNLGISNSRNIGVKNSLGRYIAFLDSDDRWDKKKLENQLYFMEKNEVSASFGTYRKIRNGRPTAIVTSKHSKYKFNDLLSGNPIGMLTVILDTKVVLKKWINFPKIDHEDYALWLSLARDHNLTFFRFSTDPLADYLVHQSKTSNKVKAAKWTFQIFYNFLGFGYLKASYYFTKYLISQIERKI
ncbi:glycosyltransferase family 2 protein [Furfurilactobacillus curtus]|uniref:Glycosyl transferase n=1 Tax=Furfurilactobacillus curtus TaxID=1746200 RepID=A0ABQ5JNE3_9LACO